MVDILFIPARYSKKIILPDDTIKRLPDKMMMFSSIQFADQLIDIQKQLAAKGKSIIMRKSKNYLYDGMSAEKGVLLGCNSEDYINFDFKAFLYIGDGLFHPKALLVNNDKDVYCYNPINNELRILAKEIHEKCSKRAKGAMIKFLSSKNIGMLMTTKIGQSNPKRAELLRDRISKKWPDKKIFMFFANDIAFSELENYNFIDIFINMACPRISNDDYSRAEKPIINGSDIERFIG